jgi:hypothetical protein
MAEVRSSHPSAVCATDSTDLRTIAMRGFLIKLSDDMSIFLHDHESITHLWKAQREMSRSHGLIAIQERGGEQWKVDAPNTGRHM